jgi:hypothetical protein
VGTLIYGSPGIAIDFDDRSLTHIQMVIIAKLRRGESFVFSWSSGVDQGSGRSSVWLDQSIPLFFRYFGSRIPEINRDWLQVLQLSADSGSGLVFTPEPPRPTPDSEILVSSRKRAAPSSVAAGLGTANRSRPSAP